MIFLMLTQALRKWVEIVFFHNYEQLKVSEKNDVIVAFFGPVKTRLHDFGIEVPNIDYPKSIRKYFGRKIWKSTIVLLIQIQINGCI